MADTRQRLERATRFFGRLISFDIECPHCGNVYQIRMVSNAQRARPNKSYDWNTARFTCHACRRIYVLGILAWPISRGNAAQATPRDQSPNMRQLAAMRREGGGWWLPDDAKQTRPIPDETNLTTETDRREGAARYAEDVDEDN